MDNKDFDKIFSDKLNETQSFEYMEADWDNVAGRISSPKKKKRRGGGWLWLFGLGFLFMAATSIYLANTLNKTNEHLVELKEAVSELEQELNNQTTLEKKAAPLSQVTTTTENSLDSSDDKNQKAKRESNVENESRVTKSKVTIQQTIVPKERITQKIKPENTLNKSTTNEFDNKQELNNSYKAIETKIDTRTETKQEITFNAEETTVANKVLGIESLWMKRLSSSLLPSKMNFKPIDDLQEVSVIEKRNKKKGLAWKYLSIGVTGGTFLSRELNGESSNGRNNPDNAFKHFDRDFGAVTFKERYGWELGLQLEYQLNPKLHLTASTHFQRNVYSGKGGTNEALAAIEVFEDSASEDALEFALDPMEVSVGESDASILFKQNMINYQLGANYLFRNNKKWRPYLGLSLSATSILKQSLYGTSELEDVGTGNQRLYNGKLAESKPGTSSSFRFTGLIPKAGFQLALNSKMNWQTEAWYRQGFNKNKDYLYGVLGLRTGVSYRF